MGFGVYGIVFMGFDVFGICYRCWFEVLVAGFRLDWAVWFLAVDIGQSVLGLLVGSWCDVAWLGRHWVGLALSVYSFVDVVLLLIVDCLDIDGC
ncbi:unnamed protein product [Ilex paraguariensis]|uniref:Transmembrane protein n=1 Tax=Ilex paraguariensis TaxID=185542 RepID=A0ABC8SGM5_9AQUA